MKSGRPKLIVILGPTASGKSGLAVAIARKFNGEIISADSRQVYRGLDIGTGKVPRDPIFVTSDITNIDVGRPYIYKGVLHHLLDVASPKRRFTVVQYKKLAQKAIKGIQRRGKIPIICGGTGFYIDALLGNIAIPEVKPDLKLRAKLEKITTKRLYEKLQKLDPRRAKNIDQFNRRRLIRALEIIHKTGKPVSSIGVIPAEAGIQDLKYGFRVEPGMTDNRYDTLFLGIKKSPIELKKLIHKRLLKRLRQGMVAEVKKLRASGLSWKRLDSFGLEYRWVARFLQKKVPRPALRRWLRQGKQAWGISYKEMVSRLQKDIEHYAKRQMAWFKRNPKINWVKNFSEAQKLVANFKNN